MKDVKNAESIYSAAGAQEHSSSLDYIQLGKLLWSVLMDTSNISEHICLKHSVSTINFYYIYNSY